MLLIFRKEFKYENFLTSIFVDVTKDLRSVTIPLHNVTIRLHNVTKRLHSVTKRLHSVTTRVKTLYLPPVFKE